MTMDVVTYLCFGQSMDAINAPEFKAPIIEAMDASLPVFVRFKHSELYKNMIMNCPPDLSRKISPATRGLVDMQQMIKGQIKDLTQHPENLKHLPHSMTIYHQLMDKEAYRTNTVPSEGSLYEEAQALMYAGSDTTGNTLMVGTFHLLKQPETFAKFKKELLSVWPKLDGEPPALRELERLPYFNAVIKESLRLSVGVVSGLLRVVPKEGATICNTFVPGGVCFSPPFMSGLEPLKVFNGISLTLASSRRSFPAAHPSSISMLQSFPPRTNSVPSAGWMTQPLRNGSFRSQVVRECVSGSIWHGWNYGCLLRTYFGSLRWSLPMKGMQLYRSSCTPLLPPFCLLLLSTLS